MMAKGARIPVSIPVRVPTVPGSDALRRDGIWWGSSAIWAWHCPTSRYMRNRRAVIRSAAITFTRAGLAYRRFGTIWQAVPANAPRVEAEGLRIEKAATNRLRYSNDLTNAAWTKTGTATVETTTIAAPVYGNFFRVRRGSEVANAVLVHQNITAGIVVGNVYCASIWLMGDAADIGKKMVFEIKRHAGPSTYAGATVEVVLTGQPQHVSVFFQTVTGNTGIAIVIHAGAATDTMADSILVACPQVEDGSSPTSPIETGSVAVMRQPDTVSMFLPAAANLEITYAEDYRNALETSFTLGSRTFTTQRAANALWAIQNRFRRSNVYKVVVRPGDRPSFDPSDKERCEFLTGTRYAKSVAVWTSLAFSIGAGFTPSAQSGKWFIVHQLHGDSDIDGRSPYLAVAMVGNDLQVNYRYHDPARPNGQSGLIEIWRWANIPRNQVIKIVTEHKVSETNGYVRIWVNGEQVGTPIENTKVGYWDHSTGGYGKFGIYRSADDYEASAEFQNYEEGTASLAGRIATPLPINTGKQVVAAVPTAGVYVLDTPALQYELINKIVAIAA